MPFIDERTLSGLVHNARRQAAHPGYVALQPIYDLIEALLRWLSSSRKRQGRSSLPPRG